MKSFFYLLASVGLALSTEDLREFFGPSEACFKYCPELKSPNFKYENGVVYVFDYFSEVDFVGQILDNDTAIPKIGMTSRAHVTVVSDCEMLLSISEVKATEGSSPYPDVYVKFSEDLQRNPLRFGFMDGKIMTVCPAKDEPLWALNFKRGLLSTFQNSMARLDKNEKAVNEDDISGECVSKYETKTEQPGIYNITRSRSASSCTPPPTRDTGHFMSNFLQLMPLLHREQKCFQSVANGKLKESTCRENIRFFFSDVGKRPVVEISTSLKHVREFKSDFVVLPTYEAYREELPMQYEDPYSEDAPTEWLQMATELIENMSGYRPTPEDFYSLTELLKLFKHEQLTDLFINTPTKNWRDALMSVLQVGSRASFNFLNDYFSVDDISHHSLRSSIHNLIKKSELSPTLINTLLEAASNTDQEKLLSDYCASDRYCYYDEKIVSKLENEIKYHDELYCMPKPDEATATNYTEEMREYNRTMKTNLRHLRKWNDVRYWNKSMASNITGCIKQHHDVNVRLAALEALRNAPCDWYSYDVLLETAKQAQFDSEYERIMVYKSLARCHPDNFADYVMGRLDGSITQETSFIWTHLLNEDGDPGFTKVASSIMTQPGISQKYTNGVKKFSRNVKRDFEILGRHFYSDVEAVFEEQQLMPKYCNIKVNALNESAGSVYKTFEQVLEIEMKEHNVHRKVIDEDYMHVIIKVRGKTICDKVLSLQKPDIDPFVLFYTVFTSGFSIASLFSTKLLAFLINNETPLTFLRKDINLYYPSAAGFPFHFKMNKTVGSYQTYKNMEGYYNGRCDISMIIDATHTNIGTNLHWKKEHIPTCNVTQENGGVIFNVLYPNTMNTVFDGEIGINNIENNVLTTRFRSANEETKTKCLDRLDEIFGGVNYCFEWTPLPDTMAFSKLKQKLYVRKQPGVIGEKLVFYKNDVSCGIHYEILGKSDAVYRIGMSKIGAFKNFEVRTPHFMVNGTGIALEDKKINITGYYDYENRQSSYSIIGNATKDRTTNNTIFRAELECKDYHAEVIMNKIKNDDNVTCDITIPYSPHGSDKTEYIHMGMKSLEVKRQADDGENRYSLSAYMNCTQWPNAGLDAEGYVGIGGKSRNTWNIGAAGSARCHDYALSCSIDGFWSDVAKVVSYSNLTGPDLLISVNKTFEGRDKNYKATKTMSYNGEKCYDLEINAGMSDTAVMYGNLTFEIPLVNHSYPLFRIQASKKYNPMFNKFECICEKQWKNNSCHMNITVGPVGVGDDMESLLALNMKEDKHYQASMITRKDDRQMSIVADSKLTNKLRDMDLNLVVKTPFKRWYEPGMKLSITKKGSTVRGNMKTMDRKGEYTKMEFEALSDYDIKTNLIDTNRK